MAIPYKVFGPAARHFCRVFSAAITLAATLAPALSCASNDLSAGADVGNAPQFVILGDRTGGHRPGVFTEMVDYAKTLPADAWISVGDLIEGYTEKESLIQQQWQELDQLLEGVQTPVHAVPGNHDIANSMQKQVWLDRYGQTYGSVRYHDILILLLDTEDPPVALPDDIIAKQNWLEKNMQLDPVATQNRLLKSRRDPTEAVKLPGSVAISDEQLHWARETLIQNGDVRWTLVVMHKPAWQYAHPGFLALEETLKLRDYTVIAGHEHYFKQEKRFGHDYITMATCGGVWLQDGPGRFDHVLSMHWEDGAPVLLNHVFQDGAFTVTPLH